MMIFPSLVTIDDEVKEEGVIKEVTGSGAKRDGEVVCSLMALWI